MGSEDEMGVELAYTDAVARAETRLREARARSGMDSGSSSTGCFFRYAATQLLSVPSLIPKSRAVAAIDLSG